MNNFNINKFYGVYETFLVFKGENKDDSPRVIALGEHLKRFKQNSEFLGLQHYSEEIIRKTLSNQINKAAIPGVNRIRIINSDSKLKVFVEKFESLTDILNIKIIAANIERPFPEIKSTSLVSSIYARKKAKEFNAFETLLVDRDGFVGEGAWTNFFWLDANKNWHTAAKGVLPGITRSLVFDFFRACGKPSIIQNESDINIVMNEVCAVFLTNAVHGMIPVAQFGEKLLPFHDYSMQLSSQFNEYRFEYLEKIL